ncbi:MAG: UDP-N-acetylglucosamine 2-epimerase, partial [Nitriliruptoraceae bacterium]
RDWPVTFLLHRPTAVILARTGLDRQLEDAGVMLRPLTRHDAFVAALARAPFVITDGGSIQEEAAALGVPCLLWRSRTERPDGVGANVVLGRYDAATTRGFLADPERFRRQAADLTAEPSRTIVEALRGLE